MKKINKKIGKIILTLTLNILLINSYNIAETVYSQDNGPLLHYEDNTGGAVVGASSDAPTGTVEPEPGSVEEQQANIKAMEALVEEIENTEPTGMNAGAAAIGEGVEDSDYEAAAEDAAATANPDMDELLSEEDDAAAAAELDAKSLRDTQFNVGEVLTLENGEQEQKYLYTTGKSPIVNFILEVIDFAITIMGSIAMILFIIAGFMFMFSQGNQQKLDEAKDIIKYAAIGLIVALLSYIITIFVQSIFVSA